MKKVFGLLILFVLCAASPAWADGIQFKRGPCASLPTLQAGEPGFCTDTYQFYIGDGTANHEVATGAFKLDDLATPDDNTDLDATITHHGLLPKLSNNAGQFFNGVGNWAVPAGGGDVLAPATNSNGYIPLWNGADSKTLADGIANGSANWNTAYSDRFKWDGGATGLTPATGRTSLELGSAALRAAEDTLTDGSNLPDGAAIKAYGDANWGGGGMVYPGAGIALSTGAAWDTSISNNSANWNTAYTDRMKWDGGATDLVPATGRTSLGLVIGTDVQAYDANNATTATKLDDFATPDDNTDLDATDVLHGLMGKADKGKLDGIEEIGRAHV